MNDRVSQQYLTVNSRIRVATSEFHFSFTRSSGPGGQNVNKVNSKATLRWNVTESPSLPRDVRERFLAKYASRLTQSGELVISSQRFRDQPKNIVDCLHRLEGWLSAVASPAKSRRASNPTRGSRERRLKTKKRKSETKRGRQGQNWDA
jgi:ribosome-associated protein